jgi:AcrR family transcriptional regulator
MPYTPAHKAETRARIVANALRLFVRHGFEAVTIDAIMAEAGLTRGGFYNHFANKQELYAEAVRSFGTATRNEGRIEVERRHGADPVAFAAGIVDAYLSRRHLENPQAHCPLMALPSDTARSSEAVRRAYRGLLETMIGMFERAAGPEDTGGRGRALAIVTLCVGGMALARAVDDPGLATELREAARAAALGLGNLPDVRDGAAAGACLAAPA